MKIKELNIISYGKINNLKINLDNNLNVIFGDNESGKTTIRSFILNVFFGGTVPGSKRAIYTKEYENYKPWSNVQFEGSIIIKYLDEEYLIQRNFQKGNEDFQIINLKNGEDSRNIFNIDTTKKVQKFDEEFFSVTENTIRNLFLFSDEYEMNENLSYDLKDKILNHFSMKSEKLSINKIIEDIENYSYSKDDKKNFKLINNKLVDSKRDLEYINSNYETNNDLKKLDILNEDIKLLNNELEFLNKELKKVMENEKNINNKKQYKGLIEEKSSLEEEISLRESSLKKENNFNNFLFLIPGVFLLLFIFNIFSRFINIVGLIFTLVLVSYLYLLNNKIKASNKVIKNELKNLYSHLDIIINNINNSNNYIDLDNTKNIIDKIDMKKDEINLLKIEREQILQKIRFVDNNFKKKLELNEEINLLNIKREEIDFKKEMGNKAVEIIKNLSKLNFETISSALVDDCSEFIKFITNNKYTKLLISENGDINLYDSELNKVVSIDSLSKGTIGQVYLSYRLGLIVNSGVDFPILIDDGFALFDSRRNIKSIDLLNNISKNFQVIYFTSSIEDMKEFNKYKNVNILNLGS